MLKAGGKRGGFVRDRHGNPVEQTTASIEQFSDSVGGFGHLLMFGQGGFLDHKDTVAKITLFARK